MEKVAWSGEEWERERKMFGRARPEPLCNDENGNLTRFRRFRALRIPGHPFDHAELNFKTLREEKEALGSRWPEHRYRPYVVVAVSFRRF